MAGGNVGPGVLVDLTALDGAPIRIDPERRVAITGASVRLGTLREVAEGHRLRMPVDPSSERFLTAGGAVSTNAAGTRTVKVGPVRSWVEELVLVTADGEVCRMTRGNRALDETSAVFRRRISAAIGDSLQQARSLVVKNFPKVRKNTAGYALDHYLESGDLIDLVIGAEGTLGAVTEVTWRLEPIPAWRGGLRVAIRDIKDLGPIVMSLRDLDPSRLEFLDGTFLRFVADEIRRHQRGDRLLEADALMLIEFEGDPETVGRRIARAEEIVRGPAIDVARGEDRQALDALWAIRYAASPRLAALGVQRRSLQIIEDGCVPIEKLGEYLATLRGVAEWHGIEVVLFGHAGDGHVHANLLPDVTAPGWETAVQAIFEQVSRAVIALGGTPAGEHGDGRLRATLSEPLFGPEIIALFHRIKKAFDPTNIFNPGIKFAKPGRPLSDLKVGQGATAIPSDIEAQLRRIERQGGYAESRVDLADRDGALG